MTEYTPNTLVEERQAMLLVTLEQLLAIEATTLKPALDAASNLLVSALRADKVDTFLHDPSIDSLVAMGTSNTPLGQRQKALGLDRLPVANLGRAVEVFQTGFSHREGHVQEDAGELVGIRQGLGIRSTVTVPLEVSGVRRGVVQVDSLHSDHFSAEDQRFLEAVAQWIGMVVHRTELVERITQAAATEARRLVAEELVTVLAHDLGNYLTPLVGHSHILRSRAEREGRTADTRAATTLIRGLGRVQRLIDDLLDTARIDQGLLNVIPHPVDMVVLVQETAETLRTPQNDVRVVVPVELVVEVDEVRVRQALENLLTNAFKHTPEGTKVVVEVRRETQAERDWAVLCVTDAGPGIAPEVMANLMERFTTSDRTHGLGLGLYLARGIAQAHGGALTVEATGGVGTTFRFAVPIV